MSLSGDEIFKVVAQYEACFRDGFGGDAFQESVEVVFDFGCRGRGRHWLCG